MTRRPTTPLALAVPARKGAAYEPEPIGSARAGGGGDGADAPLGPPPQAGGPGANVRAPDSEGTAARGQTTGDSLGDPRPAPAVRLPTSMNFKLTAEASAALREHQFRTGRAKQAIVEEALDEWLARNRALIT